MCERLSCSGAASSMSGSAPGGAIRPSSVSKGVPGAPVRRWKPRRSGSGARSNESRAQREHQQPVIVAPPRGDLLAFPEDRFLDALDGALEGGVARDADRARDRPIPCLEEARGRGAVAERVKGLPEGACLPCRFLHAARGGEDFEKAALALGRDAARAVVVRGRAGREGVSTKLCVPYRMLLFNGANPYGTKRACRKTVWMSASYGSAATRQPSRPLKKSLA